MKNVKKINPVSINKKSITHDNMHANNSTLNENNILRYQKFISRNKLINEVDNIEPNIEHNHNNSRLRNKVKLDLSYLPSESKNKVNKTEDEIFDDFSLFSHLNISHINKDNRKKLPKIKNIGPFSHSNVDTSDGRIITHYSNKKQIGKNEHQVKIKVKNLINIPKIINTQKDKRNKAAGFNQNRSFSKTPLRKNFTLSEDSQKNNKNNSSFNEDGKNNDLPTQLTQMSRPLSAGKLKFKLVPGHGTGHVIGPVRGQVPLNKNSPPNYSNNYSSNPIKLSFNNSMINSKRKPNLPDNSFIFNFNIFNTAKDDSFNSSVGSIIKESDIFEKTANFSFLQENNNSFFNPINKIPRNIEKLSDKNEDINHENNFENEFDLFDKLNKITTKDYIDNSTPQETQVESTPLTDKDVKIKSKKGFTFREEAESITKEEKNPILFETDADKIIDAIIDKNIETTIKHNRTNSNNTSTNNYTNYNTNQPQPHFKIKSKIINSNANNKSIPKNNKLFMKPIKKYNKGTKLFEINKTLGVNLKDMKDIKYMKESKLRKDHKEKREYKSNKINQTSPNQKFLPHNNHEEDYNFNSLKNIIEITKNRTDSPIQDKNAYTESNRISLNDSVRKIHNASPKIMKNHPVIKLFFEN